MSPMRSSGAVISTLTIGSSTMGRALASASRRLAPGGLERDVLRIHRVALAVVHDDAHVLKRIAGEEAGVEHRAHAFFDRRDELVRDRAALHAVDELEALAAAAAPPSGTPRRTGRRRRSGFLAVPLGPAAMVSRYGIEGSRVEVELVLR